MKKKSAFWLIIIGSLFVSGVAFSQGVSKPDPTSLSPAFLTPNCDDDKTKEVVLKKIALYPALVGKMRREGSAREKPSKEEFEKFLKQFEEENRIKYSNGKLVVEPNDMIFHLDNVRTINFNKDIEKYECAAYVHPEIIEKEKLEGIPITYTSVLADGGKKHHVTVTMYLDTF